MLIGIIAVDALSGNGMALDEQAARAVLDRIVREIADEIQPRDTFVFFAAAHGYSIKQSGRFYLIPQDYQGGTNPAALASWGIGQDRLQDWIANRIRAKKAIILLDTCRSGALTAGYARSRIDEKPSEAGVGRLHEATGRPVLTAAAAGENALEVGKLGHGVFTTALNYALRHGDRDGDGLLRMSRSMCPNLPTVAKSVPPSPSEVLATQTDSRRTSAQPEVISLSSSSCHKCGHDCRTGIRVPWATRPLRLLRCMSQQVPPRRRRERRCARWTVPAQASKDALGNLRALRAVNAALQEQWLLGAAGDVHVGS